MVFRLILFFFFLTSTALAAKEIDSPLLAEVEKKYKKAQTIHAEFDQINHIVAYDKLKKTSGYLWIKRPNKVRWETRIPEKNLFISNGDKFWFYTPPFDENDRGQVIIRDSTEVQSELMTQLLSGAINFKSGIMKIQKYNDNGFILFPKRGTAATIEKAWVFISKKRKVIWKVVLEHYAPKRESKGNWTEITLKNIKLGDHFDDDHFEFNKPAKTDVIRK